MPHSDVKIKVAVTPTPTMTRGEVKKVSDREKKWLDESKGQKQKQWGTHMIWDELD